MSIYQFENYIPVVHTSSFIHPSASLIGNVIVGKKVFIGPGASIRADFGEVIIEDGCNVQDNCVIHMFPGTTVLLRENAHIGHGAVIHGATIGYNSLIGMNSVIMDNVVVGNECIVGALSFVSSGMIIPDRKVVAGSPAKIIKDANDDIIKWKTMGTELYQTLPARYKDTSVICEPLREIPEDRNRQSAGFKSWDQIK